MVKRRKAATGTRVSPWLGRYCRLLTFLEVEQNRRTTDCENTEIGSQQSTVLLKLSAVTGVAMMKIWPFGMACHSFHTWTDCKKWYIMGDVTLLSSVKTLFISELIGNGFDKNPEGLCAKRESMEVDEVVCRQLWAFTFFFPYFRGFSTCSCHMLSCFLTSLRENLSSTCTCCTCCTCCTRMLCLGRVHPGALSPA